MNQRTLANRMKRKEDKSQNGSKPLQTIYIIRVYCPEYILKFLISKTKVTEPQQKIVMN
jgi:hypothetical protein